MFTFNFMMECAYFRGTSKSKQLFNLILHLWKLEMQGELFIHLIWVAGTQMIAQGTDGVSWGDLGNGVMSRESMLKHVPLNEGVDARSPQLIGWFVESAEGDWMVLGPKEWFHEAHVTNGNYVWCPVLAMADVALEQLCETCHTQPWNAHIFLCPVLMTSRWQKRLGKVTDAMFTVPMGTLFWGANMHEPIIIALICPLPSSRP